MCFATWPLAFLLLGALAGCAGPTPWPRQAIAPESAEERVGRLAASAMERTRAQGLAIALIEGGQPTVVRAFGLRNGRGEPLTTHTVMYGASLTKAVFAYTVMQWVDEGRVELDAPLGQMLQMPLPDHGNVPGYGRWGDLANEPRWQKITPRILLTHSAGFANFAFTEPDGRLRIHFEPGSRYAYSGDGISLLQFALEKGLGLPLGAEMQRRVFSRFGMTSSSMTWQPGFAADLADGWRADGSLEAHDERSRVRAAGSMDTTISDFARFAAGFVRGEGLSPAARREMTRAQLPITTRSQFPTPQAELPAHQRWPGLAAGLGLITFEGPQGPGFYKGGHNDSTGNLWVCLERGQRCVVLLANDVRAEAAFPTLVDTLLGRTGLPWAWEYAPQP